MSSAPGTAGGESASPSPPKPKSPPTTAPARMEHRQHSGVPYGTVNDKKGRQVPEYLRHIKSRIHSTYVANLHYREGLGRMEGRKRIELMT